MVERKLALSVPASLKDFPRLSERSEIKYIRCGNRFK